MKTPWRPVGGIVAALVAGLAIASVTKNDQNRAHVSPPRRAPSWELRGLEGQRLDSTAFKGKVVILDFWATWCGPCRMEIVATPLA